MNICSTTSTLKLYPILAGQVGVLGAIIFQQILYWTKKKPVIIENDIWCKISTAQWNKQIIFFSKSAIQRTMASLNKLGIIEVKRGAGKENHYRINKSEGNIMLDNFVIIIPEMAAKIGVNEAIFLQRLDYWMRKSNCNYEGKVWVYNTYAEWQKQLPFFSERTLKVIVAGLIEKRLIDVKKFYEESNSSVNYYSINYEQIDVICPRGTRTELLRPKIVIEQNGERSIPESTAINSWGEINTDTNLKQKKPRKKTCIEYTNDFNNAWECYPTRGGSNSKVNAYKKWDILIKEGVSAIDLISAVKNYKTACEAKDKIGTEYVMRAERFFGPAREYERFILLKEGDYESLYRKNRGKSAGEYIDKLRQYARENDIEFDL